MARPGGNPWLRDVRNSDTRKANQKRQELADEHVRKLLTLLYELVVGAGVTDVGEQVDWLNRHGHYTRHGRKWSKVTLKRVYERAKQRNIRP